MGLRAIRSKHHLSQEELSKLSGLSVRTIQRIENGGKPSTESLKCLAAALDVNILTISQEVTMNDDNSATETQEQGYPKKQVNIIVLLLAVGVILLLIGSETANQALNNDYRYIGTSFYFMAAVCFVVSAYKLFKHKITV